jgi:hypothetical protein
VAANQQNGAKGNWMGGSGGRLLGIAMVTKPGSTPRKAFGLDPDAELGPRNTSSMSTGYRHGYKNQAAHHVNHLALTSVHRMVPSLH